VNAVPRWRIAAALAILAALLSMLAALAPPYLHNLELQSYVSSLSHSPEGRAQTDGALRQQIAERARLLNLPVAESDVRINRSPDGRLAHLDVRYFVEVNFPGYAVRLHFYPGAASQ